MWGLVTRPWLYINDVLSAVALSHIYIYINVALLGDTIPLTRLRKQAYGPIIKHYYYTDVYYVDMK